MKLSQFLVLYSGFGHSIREESLIVNVLMARDIPEISHNWSLYEQVSQISKSHLDHLLLYVLHLNKLLL